MLYLHNINPNLAMYMKQPYSFTDMLRASLLVVLAMGHGMAARRTKTVVDEPGSLTLAIGIVSAPAHFAARVAIRSVEWTIPSNNAHHLYNTAGSLGA